MQKPPVRLEFIRGAVSVLCAGSACVAALVVTGVVDSESHTGRAVAALSVLMLVGAVGWLRWNPSNEVEDGDRSILVRVFDRVGAVLVAAFVIGFSGWCVARTFWTA